MGEDWNFNVLTDSWVPLRGRKGMERASVMELLTGERDAESMGHPRQDFDVLARMLLSAIVQALAPAKDAAALRDRMERPMTQLDLAPIVERYREGFNLLGERAFLQPAGGTRKGNETEALLLDVSSTSRPKLLRHDRAYDGLCPACMVLALYGCQTFAGAGGAGYRSGMRGPTSLVTLVWCPSVRRAIWANSLIEAAGGVGDKTPWRGRLIEWATEANWKGKTSRASVSVAEGVFWQPRAVRCRPVTDGACSGCGTEGRRLGAFDYGKGQGSELASEGLFVDPWLPTRTDGETWRAQTTPTRRPVWTGLAEMLAVVRGTGENRAASGATEMAAPVVQQWFGTLHESRISLAVFGQSTDKANLIGRLSENLSLSMTQDNQGVELLAALRARVTEAEEALKLLLAALRGAWSERKDSRGSFWPDDAQATFWQRSEGPFVVEKQRLEHHHSDDAGDEPETESRWAASLRSIVVALYDEHTAGAALEPRRQRLVAMQRVKLLGALKKALAPQPKTEAA